MQNDWVQGHGVGLTTETKVQRSVGAKLLGVLCAVLKDLYFTL